MYQVFDEYLNVGTWHTNHDNDSERFLRALSKVVRMEGFSPDLMRAYMLQAKSLDPDNKDQAYFVRVVDRRVIEAWAIYDFLKVDS